VASKRFSFNSGRCDEDAADEQRSAIAVNQRLKP
jgi:hypothetical protein